LYGKFSIGGKNYLQKSLVVLQFALASFLITATFIMYAQFNFLAKTDLGYDDTNLVTVPRFRTMHDEADLFKNELIKNADIIGVSAKNSGYWTSSAKTSVDSTMRFAYETVDENYLPLLKIPLVTGRNFSKDFPADAASSVIVNESFVQAAHWKNPIGETVKFLGGQKIYQVIGVVKDYHFASLAQKVGPQLFTMSTENPYGTFFIKINAKSTPASLERIQKAFKQVYPMEPYTYDFKDAQNIKQYESVAKWKQILLFGAILTGFISCIGMFGLSVLSAEKRTKEIGIRKILGASIKDIVATLSIDFIKLVVIALAIALPAGYIVADKWLQNFPYRITVSWLLFASAALMVLLIALVTVSFQSIKAAMANPAKSIKTE
jgi:putative ABC transport system permease protein